MKISSYFALALVLLFPAVTFAQFGAVDTFFFRMLSFINGILVPFVFAIAFLVFIWGVFKYFILGGDDQSKREEGKKLIVYGIVGFVIMVSVWGIVNLLVFSLGYTDQRLRSIPTVPVFRTTNTGNTGSGGSIQQGTQFPSGNVPLPTSKPTDIPSRPSGSGSSSGGEVINI